MIEFGMTLKTAREAKGLTIADIAERTHIMSSMIANLENEDFSRLPAPIYGRGFVKLYCEVVGIDAAPMIAEFMEIFNGNREPAIRERAISSPPPPEPTVEPTVESVAQSTVEPVADEPAPVEAAVPPSNDQLDLFASSSPKATAGSTGEEPFFGQSEPTSPSPPHLGSSPLEEPEVKMPEFKPEEPPKRKHPFARYAVPFRAHAVEMKGYFPTAGRFCLIAILLGLLVWGLVSGVRALYRATNSVSATTSPTSVRTEAETPVSTTDTPASPLSDAKTTRTPIPIPPLYID